MTLNPAAGAILPKTPLALRPVDQSHADRTLAALSAAEAADAKASLAATLDDEAARSLLMAAAGNAPYLARLLQREGAFLPKLLLEDALRVRDDVLSQCRADMLQAGDMAALMDVARTAKRRIALLTALADIAGAWPLERVTATLSQLADTVIEAACCWLLSKAAANGEVGLANAHTPTEGSGLIVLAMGKYGAGELNYSSDIDIIVFYEPGALAFGDGRDPKTFFVRLTRDLVKILQEPTGGGYVFRTDLRLRPDAGATAVAISTDAAEAYYETMGQNWERAAMIKARACAGDAAAGRRALDMLAPFVWRRYLDFAAIEDIHALKRQIHTHRGHAVIAIEGHDIKLGRGGIREIEFFAQIQQLIGGGKTPALRVPGTLDALAALTSEGWIDQATNAELAEAYRFLRTLEHRLQMVNDAQTHRMPTTPEGVRDIAQFMGYPEEADFRADFVRHLKAVETHYAGLFEREPALSETAGSLVFSGTEDDPETLETLRILGFSAPSTVIATVRGWHFGRISATRAARSRELLTKLTPTILRALASVDDPDQALTRFDAFLSGQPSGVQFFSLLFQNPALLNLIAGIMGAAPMLARYMLEHPNVLEAVIAADFYSPLPDAIARAEQVAAVLQHADGFEQALDLVRIYAREQLFQIGVHVLTGTAPAREAGPAYADLAAAVVAGFVPVAQKDVQHAHGTLEGGEMAVLALGKLGGLEMAATSDLDLIVIYEFDDATPTSDGPRPIGGSRYYTRICQRLISALTAPTAEGPLYEVDMRLRPSGRAGPLATRLRSFIAYQKDSAWTWEKMALTRARVISGPAALRARVDAAIRDVLCEPRDAALVAQDAVAMRERVYAELGSDALWNIKHGRGGLVDLEFITQALQLIHASADPHLLDTNTRAALAKLTHAGILSHQTGQHLMEAADRYHNLTQVLRIAVDGPFNPASAAGSLKDRLARAIGAPSFSVVERELAESRALVDDAFASLITGLAR